MGGWVDGWIHDRCFVFNHTIVVDFCVILSPEYF